jgi:hypothetical protein
MYYSTVPQFIKMLNNMNTLFDKAKQNADARKYDVNVLLQTRLAPDQYPFVKQVQVVCDNAKGCGARLAGKEIPKHEDNETTLEQLRERVAKTISFLKTLRADDFRGAEDRKVEMPWMPGKILNGQEYVNELALPNFYFHYTTAYSILRASGVDVGKMDYLGNLPFKDKK